MRPCSLSCPRVLSFFLVPSNIMVSLGLAGITSRAIGYARAGRWLVIASTVLIAAVGVLPIGSGLALPLERDFPVGMQREARQQASSCLVGV